VATDFLFGLAGMAYDQDTVLYRTLARVYSPASGKFQSPDPSGMAGSGTNLEEYAGNSPVENEDPSGLDTMGYCPQSKYSAGLAFGTDPNTMINIGGQLGGTSSGFTLGEDGPWFSTDSTAVSPGDLLPDAPLPEDDPFPSAEPGPQVPYQFHLEIAVNQDSDWSGLADINEQRRYEAVLEAQGLQIDQTRKEWQQFNRNGNVQADGTLEAFEKATYFGAINVASAVAEPLLALTDTVTVGGSEIYNANEGTDVELPIFSMSYKSYEARYHAGESYASVAWSGTWRVPANTATLGTFGTVEGTANYIQTGSPQAMQMAAAGQVILTLGAASVPADPALPAVLDPYEGSPMGANSYLGSGTIDVSPATGALLSAPDAALVNSLQAGADVPITAGTQGIRTMMSDLTLNTGNEVALLRMIDGSRVLRMGGPTNVSLDLDVESIIAHTHPSGRLAYSTADIAALNARGQYSSVIIDPNANMGARIPVPSPSP
jgi:RHS repeat-associated protein